MKKNLLFIGLAMMGLASCCKNADTNPFFEAYDTPYGAPPFELIKNEHYIPAFEQGMKEHAAEIAAIVSNTEAPTFENTIVAMENTGELIGKVSSVFYNLMSSNTSDELEAIAMEILPSTTEHYDNIMLNEGLFARVKAVYNSEEAKDLNAEQKRLLEKTYKSFERSGANLSEESKVRLRELNKLIGTNELQFGKNVLAETNAYEYWVNDEAELAGLPEGVCQAAKEEAKAKGKPEQWLFTTHKSSFLPVLQYSENRALRKELLMAYNARADRGNENDNNKIINELMKQRTERAHLFGFESSAAFILDDTMAKTTDAVYDFLQSVWKPSVAQAKREAAELQKLMDAEGKGEKLEPWDWWYYAEQLRKAKYDLDEEEVKPYFKMENVRAGAFQLATNLWGLQFEPIKDIPVYHEEVEAFKVSDADGSLIGVLYTDYYPRASKRGGAWMSNYTEQYKKDGVNHRPIIVNVGNFTKPTADKPSLLTMDEVATLFHEFGHALHGLLAQATYKSLSGTNVARDFVELPSQVMENWCFEPQVMKTYAKHYKTGEVIPDALIEKINNAGTFNQGFVMTELLSASIMDMDYHSMTEVKDIDAAEFEKASLAKMGMIDEIIVRYRSTFFNHIFTGGYSAGYYSYTWAAVLDADAFAAFKETGDIYNPEVAKAFRENVLERGGTADPMELYETFRGKKADAKYLLIKRGFVN